MKILDAELKLRVIDAAISSLIDEYQERNDGHFPLLGQLEEFADTIGANHEAICDLLNERNAVPVGSFTDILSRYPTFLEDLARNIGYESIPRSIRPARDVT